MMFIATTKSDKLFIDVNADELNDLEPPK